MTLEITKSEACGDRAFYYIKEPSPEGEIKIFLCRDHVVKLDTDNYYYHFFAPDTPVYCQESI